MPGMSGPDLARAASRLKPSCAFSTRPATRASRTRRSRIRTSTSSASPSRPQALVSRCETVSTPIGRGAGACSDGRQRACERLLGVAGAAERLIASTSSNDPKKRSSSSGVELRAALLLHHLAGLVGLESRAVDAVGGERVEDVGDGAMRPSIGIASPARPAG